MGSWGLTLRIAAALSLGLGVATHVFALQCRYDAALGRPLATFGFLSVYAPWRVLTWAWWWGSRVGFDPFLLGFLLGGGSAAFVLAKTVAPRAKQGEAHWATRRELTRAKCLGPPGSGPVLGVWHGQVLRYQGEGHIFALGNTGSGKTASLLPTILECPHSVFVYDPKDGIYPKTAGRRKQVGRVVRLAPMDPHTDGYDPLSAVRVGTDDEYADVSQIAMFLTNPDGKTQQFAPAEYFQNVVQNFFSGLLLYGLHSGIATTCGAFNDLITRTPWPDLIMNMQHDAHDEVARAGESASRINPRELGSVQTTAQRAMSVFNDPRVARMTSRGTFTLDELRERETPCTVYYHVPFGDAERLRALSRLLMRQMIGRTTAHLGGWRQPLLVTIDEMPSLDRLGILSEALNFVREYGVRLFYLTPSMEEVVEHYGPHHNFLEGSLVKLIFGVEDGKVAELISTRIGKHTVRFTRRTVQSGGRTSVTHDERLEPLLSATGLQQMSETGQVLVLVGKVSVIAQQARYYQDGQWHGWSLLPVK